MLIYHVYAVAMKTLCVNLKGKPDTIRLDVEKVVDDNNELTLTAFDVKGEKIGTFNLSDVAGWWTEK
jgi:hypothetical protein